MRFKALKQWHILLVFAFVLFFYLSQNKQFVANVTRHSQTSQIVPAQEPLTALQITFIDQNTKTNIRVLNFDKITEKVQDFNKTFYGKIIVLAKSLNQDCILFMNQTVYTNSTNSTNSNQTSNQTSNSDINSTTDSNQRTNYTFTQTSRSFSQLFIGAQQMNSSANNTYQVYNNSTDVIYQMNNQTTNMSYYQLNNTTNTTYQMNTTQTTNTSYQLNNTQTNITYQYQAYNDMNITTNNTSNTTNSSNQTNQPKYKLFLMKINFQSSQMIQINITQEIISFNESKFTVGSQCNAYAIDNMVYFRSTLNTFYYYQTNTVQTYQAIPLEFQPIAFDNTLTHMIANNNLYELDTSSMQYASKAKLNPLTKANIYSKDQKLIVHAIQETSNYSKLSFYAYWQQNNKLLPRGNYTNTFIKDSFYLPSVSQNLNYYFLQAILPNHQPILIGKWIDYVNHNQTLDVVIQDQLVKFFNRGIFSSMVTEAFLVLYQQHTFQLNKYLFYFLLNQNKAQVINIQLLPKNQSNSSDISYFIQSSNYQNLVYFSYENQEAQTFIYKTSFTQSHILSRINIQQSKYYITSWLYPRTFYLNFNPHTFSSLLSVYFIDLSTLVQKNMSLNIPGNWKFLAGANQTLTCVMAQQISSKFVYIARNNFQTAQITQLTNITDLLLQSNASTNSIFHVASDCSTFAIDKNIFIYNISKLKYQSVILPSSNWSPVQFDQTFKYGIGKDGTLAVLNSSTKSYSLIRVQGLSNILLQTYNSTSYLEIFAYQNKILLYTKYDQRSKNLSVHLITVSNNIYTLQKSIILKRPIQNQDSLISFSLDLNSVIILGNDLSTSVSTGKGFYFKNSSSIQDIIISPQIPYFLSNYPLDIQISANHVYLRSLLKSSQDNSPQFQAFYKFQGNHMIKLGQRPLTHQNSMAWQKTILIQQRSTQNTLIYVNQLNYNGIVSLYEYTFVKSFTIPNTLFQIDFSIGGNILQSSSSFKWIEYKYQQSLDMSAIVGYQLVQNQTNYKQSKFQNIKELYEAQYTIIGGTQQSHDCVAVLIKDLFAINLFKLVKNSATGNKVELFSTITPYFLSYYFENGGNFSNLQKIDVAKQCAGFTINNAIYRYNQTAQIFTKAQLPTGFTWRSLDQSFNYSQGSTSNNTSMILTYQSSTNSYYQMPVSTVNQVSHNNISSLNIQDLNISSTWIYFNSKVPNVLLTQYVQASRKSVGIFKIISSNSSKSNLSLIQLISISDKNAKLYKSDLLTKIVFGVKNQAGYEANIRSYNFSQTNNSISTEISLPQQLQNSTFDLYFALSQTHMYVNDFMNENSNSTSNLNQFYYKFINSSTSTQLLLKDIVVLLSNQLYTKALIAKVKPTQNIQMVLLSEFSYQNKQYISWYQVPSLSAQQKATPINIGQGVISNGGIFYLCPSNCAICNKKSQCIICIDQFYQKNNKCQSCISGCETCQNNINCTKCLQSYFLLSNNSCSLCDSSCLTCDKTSTNCTSCKIGQALNSSNNKCENCSSNCIKCSSKTNCTKCRPGYTIKNQVCVECLPGCSDCDPIVRTTCLSCVQRYYLSGSTCKNCPSNCITCTSSSICKDCDLGYKLNNSSCVLACQYPCFTCQTGQVCLSCYGGYSFDSSTKSCTPDLSCNMDLSCTGCPFSYVLFQDNSCQNCSTNANCFQCSSIDTSICAICQTGFYLNSGSCTSCPKQCAQCVLNNLCTTCLSGYYLSSQNVGLCLPCTSPCLSCNKTSDICLSCIESYTLNGFKCIKKDRAQFQIRLGGDLTSFFSNMDLFKSAVMAKINRTDLQSFTYTSIVSGSVVTEGSVASSSTGTSAATSSALQSAVTSGSTIGGYSVQSATFTSTTSNNSTSEGSSNIGLIIGIIIGIIVLIVIIILIVYYCKKKTQQKKAGYGSSSKRKRKYQKSQNCDSLQSQSYKTNSVNKLKQKNNIYEMQQVRYPYKPPAPTAVNYAKQQYNPYEPKKNQKADKINSPIYDQEQIQDDLISDFVQSAEQLQKYDKKNPKRPYL